MNAAAIVVLFATSAADPTDDAIQTAIRDLHARTVSMNEFLKRIRWSRSAGPMGAALSSLLRLASDSDAMLAFPANLALLDNDFYLSDEEFDKADREWRRYIWSDRWFAASRDTPSVTTSNE